MYDLWYEDNQRIFSKILQNPRKSVRTRATISLPFNFRKVFGTSAELMNNSQSIPNYLRKKMNEETTTSVFYIERDFEETGKLRFAPKIIPEYSEKQQDYELPTRVDENSVSVFCAKVSLILGTLSNMQKQF